MGVLAAGAIMFCCVASRGGYDHPERAKAIRETSGQNAAEPSSPQERTEETEAVKREIRPAAGPDRAETASRCAQRIAVALRSGRTADKELVFTKLLPELLQLDFPLAVRTVERLESWAWREEAMKYLIQEWAALNPIEAANWAARLPVLSERNAVVEQLCLRVGAHDPAQAVTIAERFGGPRNSVLLEQLVSLWAASDSDAAAQWAARQPQGELRNKVYARLAMLRAEVAPAEAAELVADRIPAGEVQTEAAMSVLHQWILRDPAGAASWVELFPHGDLRRRAEEELASALRYQSSQSMAEASIQ